MHYQAREGKFSTFHKEDASRKWKLWLFNTSFLNRLIYRA